VGKACSWLGGSDTNSWAGTPRVDASVEPNRQAPLDGHRSHRPRVLSSASVPTGGYWVPSRVIFGVMMLAIVAATIEQEAPRFAGTVGSWPMLVSLNERLSAPHHQGLRTKSALTLGGSVRVFLDGPNGNWWIDGGLAYAEYQDAAAVPDWLRPEIGVGWRWGTDSRARVSCRGLIAEANDGRDFDGLSLGANVVFGFECA